MADEIKFVSKNGVSTPVLTVEQAAQSEALENTANYAAMHGGQKSPFVLQGEDSLKAQQRLRKDFLPYAKFADANQDGFLGEAERKVLSGLVNAMADMTSDQRANLNTAIGNMSEIKLKNTNQKAFDGAESGSPANPGKAPLQKQ